MADKKISDGATRTLAITDVFEVEAPGNAVQYKTTLAALRDALEDGGIVELQDIDATKLTAGTLADARVAESNVTQHQQAVFRATVTQASHGFAVKDLVGHNGSAYVKANADSATKIRAIGMVVAVTDANTFTWAWSGVQTVSAHGFTLALHYLSTTAGGAVTTAPGPDHLVQEVFTALGANSILLHPRVGMS